MPGKRFGEIALEKGFVSAAQLEQALALQQEKDNRAIGECLMAIGALNSSQLLEVLQQQELTPTWCPSCHRRYNLKLPLLPRDTKCPHCKLKLTVHLLNTGGAIQLLQPQPDDASSKPQGQHKTTSRRRRRASPPKQSQELPLFSIVVSLIILVPLWTAVYWRWSRPTPKPPAPSKVQKPLAQLKPRQLFLEGRKAYQHQQYLRALTFFSQMLQKRPRDGCGLYYRGQTYYHLKHYQKALQDLNQCIRAGFRKAGVWALRARLREHQHDLHGALQDLTQATKLAPRNVDYANNRIRLMRKLGQVIEALAEVHRLIRYMPAIRQVIKPLRRQILSKVENLERHKQYQQAHQLISAAIAHDPTYHLFYYQRARLASQDAKVKTVLKDIKHALQYSPSNDSQRYRYPLLGLHYCLYTVNKPQAALAMAQEVLRYLGAQHPHRQEVYICKAEALTRLGRLQEAYQVLRQTCQSGRRPGPRVQVLRAQLLFAMHKYDRAWQQLRDFCTTPDADLLPTVLVLLGRIAYVRKDLAAAHVFLHICKRVDKAGYHNEKFYQSLQKLIKEVGPFDSSKVAAIVDQVISLHLIVRRASPGSGLQKGDVIEKYNQQRIYTQFELQYHLRQTPQQKLTIRRGQQQLEITLKSGMHGVALSYQIAFPK